jgi:hypothetical protein
MLGAHTKQTDNWGFPSALPYRSATSFRLFLFRW